MSLSFKVNATTLMMMMTTTTRLMWLGVVVVVVVLLQHSELSTVVAVELGDTEQLGELWAQFKVKFNKQYDDEDEENYRREVFARNVDHVRLHNLQADVGLHSNTLGINALSDMTDDEVSRKRTGLFTPQLTEIDRNARLQTPTDDLPEAIDWRDKGYVTPVKDQSHCGSCWAFSAVGALEGMNFRKTGKLVSLSEQQLVDCTHGRYNDGCCGGLPDASFEWLAQHKGLDTEESYPYHANDCWVCRFNASTVGATTSGNLIISRGSEDDLKAGVAKFGPISVGVNANAHGFMRYKDGVFTAPNSCRGLDDVDHAVLVVGYGKSDAGLDYWIIKNSWGTSWGNNGYMLLARNQNNTCCVALFGNYPQP